MGKNIYAYDYQPQGGDILKPSQVKRYLTENVTTDPDGKESFTHKTQAELNTPEAKKQMSLFNADKKGYSKLFQVRQGISKNPNNQGVVSEIFGEGANNSPRLSATLPSGLPFTIKPDGNGFVLSLPENLNNLTKEQVLELKNFMYHNGMKDVYVDSLDEKLQQTYQETDQQNAEVRGYWSNWFGKGENEPVKNDVTSADWHKLHTWMHGEIEKSGRVLGDTFFVEHNGKNDIAFHLYSKPKEDGDGQAPEFSMRVFRQKIRGEWVLVIQLSVPYGAKMSDWHAEKTVELMKELKVQEFDVSGLYNDDFKALFRQKGAREGMLAIGSTMNEQHAKNMRKEAEGKISSNPNDEYNQHTFRKNLIRRMHMKGDARNAEYVEQGQGNDWFFKFSDTWFDGCYDVDIKKENSTNDSAKIYGAGIALGNMIDEAFSNKSLTDSEMGWINNETVLKKQFEKDLSEYIEKCELKKKELENKPSKTKEDSKDIITYQNQIAQYKLAIEGYNRVAKILKRELDNGAKKPRDIDYEVYWEEIYPAIKARKAAEINIKYARAYEESNPRAAEGVMGTFGTSARNMISSMNRVKNKYEVGWRDAALGNGEYKGPLGGGIYDLRANSKNEGRKNTGYDDDEQEGNNKEKSKKNNHSGNNVSNRNNPKYQGGR